MKSFKELHEEYLEEKEFPKLKQRKDVSSKTESGKDKSTPEKNYRGLSKSTAQKRENHWKKQRKKHHSDSSAYEPAPGDEGAKTKPSKYTQAYHKKYGDPSKEKKVNEDVEGVNIPSETSKEIERLAKSYNVEVSEIVKLYRKLYGRYQIMMRTGNNASSPNEKEAKILHGSTMSAVKKALDKKDDDVNSEMKRRTMGGQERPVREPQDDRFAEMKRRSRMESTQSSIKERVLNEYYENVFEINPVELYGEYLEEGKADTGLAAKAKKSGISLSTLRTVYNRGMAAWRGSHRPGTTPQQWANARVNSYIAKGKTYHTADADLHGGKKKTSDKKKGSSTTKSTKPRTKTGRGGRTKLHP